MSPRFVLGRENVPCVAEVVNRSLKADCTDESTICNDRISLPGVAGCLGGAISSPVDPGQSPGEGPGGKAPSCSSDPAVHSTKKCPQKATFLVHFYLCSAYKLKGKIHLN